MVRRCPSFETATPFWMFGPVSSQARMKGWDGSMGVAFVISVFERECDWEAGLHPFCEAEDVVFEG